MATAEVYEAYDDFEEEEAYYEEGAGEEYWINDQAAGEEEEELDEDEFGPGVTVSWSSNKPVKREVPVSDVGEEAYLDPLGLVNCWEEALVDLKVRPHNTPSLGRLLELIERSHITQATHPDRFFPPSEAPRSLSQRQSKAPL